MNTDEKNAGQRKMPKNVVSKFYRLTMSIKRGHGCEEHHLFASRVWGCGVAIK